MFSFESKLSSLILYVVVFTASSCCLATAAKKESKSSRNLFFILAVLFPSILSAFRLCGTDLGLYFKIFSQTSAVSWYEAFTSGEYPLFYLLVKVGDVLGGFPFFLFFSSIITCVPICMSLYHSREKLCLGLAYTVFLFGCLTTSWNILRQFLAVGVTVFAVQYVFSRDLWKFVLCVFVACLFHPTSVVMLAVYPLWTKEQRLPAGWKLFLYYASAIVFVLCLGVVFTSLPGVLGEEYNSYLIRGNAGKNRDFLVDLFWLSVFLFQRKRLSVINPRNEYYLALFGLVCVVGLTGYFSPFIKRIGVYFSVFQCFLIGSLPLRASEKPSVETKGEFRRISSRISRIRQGTQEKGSRRFLFGISSVRLFELKKRFREIPSQNSFLCDLKVWLALYLAVFGLFFLVAYIMGQAMLFPYRIPGWEYGQYGF